MKFISLLTTRATVDFRQSRGGAREARERHRNLKRIILTAQCFSPPGSAPGPTRRQSHASVAAVDASGMSPFVIAPRALSPRSRITRARTPDRQSAFVSPRRMPEGYYLSDEEHSSRSLYENSSRSSSVVRRDRSPLIVDRFLFPQENPAYICFRQAGSVSAPLPGAAASGIRDAIILPQIRRRNPALTHKSFDPR